MYPYWPTILNILHDVVSKEMALEWELLEPGRKLEGDKSTLSQGILEESELVIED